MNVSLKTPVSREGARKLKAGDIVKITGIIYTARDAAHKRMLENREKGFPMEIKDCCIYFAGPSPTKPGDAVGSIGPTTSYRMDKYSPEMIKYGETIMIGKGKRSFEVIEAMKKYGCVYIGAIGGAGALLASHVLECETIAYEDLGAEAIHRLYVKDFPGIVVIDAEGNNLYETEPEKYRRN
ncbi:MAG: Fe-S-containing hydro-lyase [Clostridiales bacterium]|nr:Fe-S-containing hydro-lyase [Clostridiales bacterium]